MKSRVTGLIGSFTHHLTMLSCMFHTGLVRQTPLLVDQIQSNIGPKMIRKYSITTHRLNHDLKPANVGFASTLAGGDTSKNGCLTCLKLVLSECQKISIPGCRKVRDNIKCVKFSLPPDCQPARAPYSSYHECVNKKPLRPADPDDCRCCDKTCARTNREVFWATPR